jgi:predicted amidohydrolase
MQPIRIAAITLNGVLGETARNLEAVARWTRCACDAGAELILFPELAISGHCDPRTWHNAEPVPDGAQTQRIVALAREHGVFLSVGLSEKQRDIVYNTQVLAGPGGFIGAQRKIHLSRDEVLYYKGGEAIDVFDIGKCAVGTSICYDCWSPEVSRILAVKGADVLLMPHASRMRMWTEGDAESEAAAARHAANFFRTMYRTRSFENACYSVVVNQAGRAGTVPMYPSDSPNQPHHAGGCMVIDPVGEIAAELPDDRIEEAMLIADLEPERLWAARSDPNYSLRTRRPELYRALA